MSDDANGSGDPGSPPEGGEYMQQGNDGSSIREQDRFLPIANIGRIMKRALPSNGKVAKDAKETVQECVSEFISFITSEASDKCQREKRKTINGDDLLWAMSTLGFEDYVEPLKVYLHKYRETEGEKASLAKQGGGDMGRKDSVQMGSYHQALQPGYGGPTYGAQFAPPPSGNPYQNQQPNSGPS